MDETTHAYPLLWPEGHPRTDEHAREVARFSHKSRSGEHNYSVARPLTLYQARQRLEQEVWRVAGVSSYVLSTDIPLRKSDGQPRAGRRAPDDPGVAVYWTEHGKDKCIPCDRWTRIEDNIAAVAATIAPFAESIDG